MSRVVAVAVHPTQAAGTRLRFGPVLAALERRGVDTELRTFLTDGELDGWLARGRSMFLPAFRGIARIPRVIRAVRRSQLLLVQRESLPFNCLLLEKLAHRRHIPLVWDVDDSLWIYYGPLRSIVRGDARKSMWLARHANEVWVGNEQVADWAEAAGAHVVRLVPTAVVVPDAVTEDGREDDLLVWIGTPSTGPFIEALLHDLRFQLGGWRVLIVGASIAVPDGVDATQQPWSMAAEADALRRATVGLYPLDVNHPGVAGKSALKAILFMANGIPVIATSTLSNNAVMKQGIHGYLVSTTGDWCDALEHLRDPELRRKMGANGHRHGAERYDGASWGEQLADRVMALLPQPAQLVEPSSGSGKSGPR